MNTFHPYVLDPDRVDRFADGEAQRPPQRVDVQRHHLEHEKMRVNAFDIEQHALALHAQRIHAAQRAGQVREARGARAGAQKRVRAALGAMLIAAGQRLREEPAIRHENETAADALRYHA